ncbi:MAG: hypothetical protein GY869_14190, partial [Planctomycetes bacterium]|nr:hypothetical protein [Planctomycetota bacterium]
KVTINHTGIGRLEHGTPGEPDVGFVYIGNGEHGIALTGGVHDMTIGDINRDRAVSIVDHINGAGIYLSGKTTQNNYVVGCNIGFDFFHPATVKGNKYGIQITNGSHSNTIGLRGGYQFSFQDGNFFQFESANTIHGSFEAGILLESGGQVSGTSSRNKPPSTPTGANVIQNNNIGSFQSATNKANKVGMLLRGEAFANRIGGNGPSEGNTFGNNNRAGIEISGMKLQDPVFANRIIGNSFINHGILVDTVSNPQKEFPNGVGIAVTGGSSGHIIGGPAQSDANYFGFNQVG